MADLNQILKEVTTELTETYKPDYTKIEEQRAAEQKALDAERDRQQGILDRNLFNANQQAYITRMQAQRDMPQQLAAQGIRGGATETTLNNIYNNYLNARNAAKSSYDESTGALSSNYNTNNASLGSKYAQMIADLDSEKRNQALTLAQIRYQQAVEEEERQRQAAAAAAAGSYGGGGGGSGSTGGGTIRYTTDGKGNAQAVSYYDNSGRQVGYGSQMGGSPTAKSRYGYYDSKGKWHQY